MSKDYEVTSFLRINTHKIHKLIKKNEDKFFCPFSNKNSYLNIYRGKECDVKFFNLQHCDYSGTAAHTGYIRYLMRVEKTLNDIKSYQFLKDNFEKFCIETNEENFIIPDKDPLVVEILNELDEIWSFDSSNKLQGRLRRTRLVKLPAGGIMPYHRDETASNHIRVICPIIIHEEIKNAFRDKTGERFYNLKSDGFFYAFLDSSIEHAVFNKSAIDRYTLVFTVKNIKSLSLWDKKYHKMQKRKKLYGT